MIHVETPNDMISFLQESGRSGRDGRKSYSYIVQIPGNREDYEPSSELDVGEPGCDGDDDLAYLERMGCVSESNQYGDMSFMVQPDEKTIFRRWPLEIFIDGVVDRRSCSSLALVECDLCEESSGITIGTAGKKTATIEETPKGNGGGRNTPLVAARKAVSSPDLNIRRNLFSTQQQGAPAAEGKKRNDNSPTLIRPLPVSATPLQTFVSRRRNVDYSSMSSTPSQDVDTRRLRLLVQELKVVCAVCSVQQRRRVHHPFTSGQDEQKCDAFRNHCFRCASAKHRWKQCPYMEKGEQGRPNDQKC